MAGRIRSRVWRELPYSARRSLLGVARTADRIDRWVTETWQSLHKSPAWVFVAVVGTLGMLLTLLLFLSLGQDLNAGSPQDGRVTVEVETHSQDDNELDSRLMVQAPKPAPDYAASFEFAEEPVRSRAPNQRSSRPSRTVDLTLDEQQPTQSLPQKTSRNPAAAPWPDFDQRRTVVEEPQLEPTVHFQRDQSSLASGSTPVQTISSRSGANHNDRTAHIRLPSQPDGWSPHQNLAAVHVTLPQRYAGEIDESSGGVIGAKAIEADPFADATAWNPHAEISYQVELHAPKHGGLMQHNQVALVIRNTGRETIRRLSVQEPLKQLEIVTGASPGGPVHGDVLERDLVQLRAGRGQTLSLEWFPAVKGSRVYSAHIQAEAFVGTTVDVAAVHAVTPKVEPIVPHLHPLDDAAAERPAAPSRDWKTANAQPGGFPADPVTPAAAVATPERQPVTPRSRRPAVECAVHANPTIHIGEVAEFTIDVRNTGEMILHNVVLLAQVPPGLRHRYGTSVECPIGKLSPGQSRQVPLRAIGEQPGQLVTTFRVAADEPVQAAAEARILIAAGTPAAAIPSPAMLVTSIANPARLLSRDDADDCGCAPSAP